MGTKQRQTDAGSHQGGQLNDHENVSKHRNALAEQCAFPQSVGGGFHADAVFAVGRKRSSADFALTMVILPAHDGVYDKKRKQEDTP